MINRLRNLDFGGGDDGGIFAGAGPGGYFAFGSAPAVVAELAAFGELGGVGGTDELVFVGIDFGGDDYGSAFGFGAKGANSEEAFDGGGGIAVDIANGGADLGVGVVGERFFEEVDEAGFALEDGEEGDGIGACGRGCGVCCSVVGGCWWKGEGPRGCGEVSIEEDAPEKLPGCKKSFHRFPWKIITTPPSDGGLSPPCQGGGV